MNQTHRKCLTAVVLASFISPLYAADIASGTAKTRIANEYVAVADFDTVQAQDILVELLAEYAINDVITLTFTGGDALDTGSLDPSITYAVAPPLKGITLGLLDVRVTADQTEVDYRVTDVTGGAVDSTTGRMIEFQGLRFDLEKAQSTRINVSYSAVTNKGEPLDTGINGATDPVNAADNVDLFEFVDQYALEIAQAFDATVDVEQDRQGFINASGNPETLATLQLDLDEALLVGSDIGVDIGDVTVTVSGNFSWIKDTDEASDGIQPQGGVVTFIGSGIGMCEADFAGGALTTETLTIDCNDSHFEGVTVELETAANGGDVELPLTTYTATADIGYENRTDSTLTGTRTISDLEAGEWTLNGSITFIPYMPYNRSDLTTIEQIIQITNTSMRATPIEVRAIREDGTVFDLSSDDLGGLEAAPGVTSIASELQSALIAKGALSGSAATHRFALEIMVADSNDAIQVYSAYRVNGSDSGWVQNDSKIIRQVKKAGIS